jgi:glycosyltransferase involved in cell wall biosynthesis
LPIAPEGGGLAPQSRVLIVSDAWRPQMNGVVRTLHKLVDELAALGIVAEIIGPDRFRTLPCPTYPDIRLSVLPRRGLARMVEAFRPDALHIATEGPLGIAAKKLARRRGWSFTTAFHTRFPEYLAARLYVPTSWSYAWLRQFHNAGHGLMVATESLRQELAARGFHHLRAWSRGVDLLQFKPEPRDPWQGLPRPIFLYVGRVAIEKNIAAFLNLDLPGSKIVVGDGPQLAQLKRNFPRVHFDGARHGEALSRAYAGADVMVFPSLTDTFGLVMLESLACGTPVAAFPATGPKDVLAAGGPRIGCVHADLRHAALQALAHGDRAACRDYARTYSWQACAERFIANLVPIHHGLKVVSLAGS